MGKTSRITGEDNRPGCQGWLQFAKEGACLSANATFERAPSRGYKNLGYISSKKTVPACKKTEDVRIILTALESPSVLFLLVRNDDFPTGSHRRQT